MGDPVTNQHRAEQISHDDAYINDVQVHPDPFLLRQLAARNKQQRRFPVDGDLIALMEGNGSASSPEGDKISSNVSNSASLRRSLEPAETNTLPEA
jgi:hypothetical protein